MTTTTPEPTIAADLLHAALGEDPDFDRWGAAESAIRSAILAAVSALAYLDGNPDRMGYLRALVDDHPGADAIELLTGAVWQLEQRRDGCE